jgi:spermidine dehydrogenase
MLPKAMSKRANTLSQSDRLLGMDQNISRRDFLNSSLLAASSLLLSSVSPLDLLAHETASDWNGYGGVGDYRDSHGDTLEIMAAGHGIRDHALHSFGTAVDTKEVFDCVVVGGGISGLAAALFFERESPGKRTCMVLDNRPVFGGQAQRNEFVVDDQRLIAHQASTLFFPPLPDTFLADFYRSIGIHEARFEYQGWGGKSAEMPLGNTPYTEGGKNSGFYFGEKFGQNPGRWLIDPWGKNLQGAPIPAQSREELLRMQRGPVDGPQRLIPKVHGDPGSRLLDSVTLEEHLMHKFGISRETIRTFLAPVAGGGSGIGPDALSAYADYAADVLLPWDYNAGAQMFPGGNAGVARHMLKALLPAAISGPDTLAGVCQGGIRFAALDRLGQRVRIRLNTIVLAVRHEGSPETDGLINVTYMRRGKLYRLKARTVIMAGGSLTTKHVVEQLPAKHREAYAQFHRPACLMANVAVRNWRFLYKLGISECQWFDGLGNYMTVHKVARFGAASATISPDSPTVLTLKILFSYPGLPIEVQVRRGREELLATSFRDYEQRIRRQFTEMFTRSGFDARRDIAGIILNRWGHAYLAPQPGFFFGKAGQPAPGEVIRSSPFGSISFANSDLAGIMDHRTSILEGHRAVRQSLESLSA